MTNDEELKQIYKAARVIAVVGLSSHIDRASHPIAFYLQSLGYKVIPVNPNAVTQEIIGERVYPNLSAIPQPIDVVQIFRKPRDVPPVVDEAIKVGAQVIWMQLGIRHPRAAARAKAAGLQVVMNKCMMEQHLNLFGKRFVPGE
jgi:uncharacterized protein